MPKQSQEETEKLIKEKDKFMLRYLQAMEFSDARLMEDHDIAFNNTIKQALQSISQSAKEEERERILKASPEELMPGINANEPYAKGHNSCRDKFRQIIKGE